MTQATTSGRRRTHVITGAGSGIGLALAQELAGRGDRVVLLVRSQQRVDDVARAVPSHHSILPLDLSDPEGVAANARDLLAGVPDVDAVDSLVHCAGVVDLAPVARTGLAAWQRQLDVNLTSPMLLTAALLPRLRAARGSVVFVNSGAGLAAHAEWAAYAASKHGLKALADSLRAEEAGHGVRVSSIYPGRTATAMQEKVHQQEGKDYDPQEWISPDSVVGAICHVLDLAPDATIPDLTVRPAPRR